MRHIVCLGWTGQVVKLSFIIIRSCCISLVQWEPHLKKKREYDPSQLTLPSNLKSPRMLWDMLFVYSSGTFKYNTLSYKYIIYNLISIYVYLYIHPHSNKYIISHTMSIHNMNKKYFSMQNPSKGTAHCSWLMSQVLHSLGSTLSIYQRPKRVNWGIQKK